MRRVYKHKRGYFSKPRAYPGFDYFWSHVQKWDGGCWIWKDPRGEPQPYTYGSSAAWRISNRASRFSWAFFHGWIPPGMCILHKCDRPGCVNPDHLYPGTKSDNNLDQWNKDRWPEQALENCNERRNPSWMTL